MRRINFKESTEDTDAGSDAKGVAKEGRTRSMGVRQANDPAQTPANEGNKN